MDPEIDLVPGDYRRRLQLRRWLRNFALACAGAVGIVGLTRAALAYGIRVEEKQIEALQSAEAEALARRSRLEALQAERAEMERRLAILTALQGGVAAREMFVAMDRALDGSVRFRHWSFRRAGEVVESEAEPVEAGYFVVLPRAPKEDAEKAWLMRTHMEIRGHARDHTALAEFVSRLVKQPEIADVRVLSTGVRRHVSAQVVDFELAVGVRTRT